MRSPEHKRENVMSSIASVGSSNFNPYQFTPQVALQSSAASSSAQSTSAIANSTSGTASTGTSFQDQLVTAITTAVQNAEQSGNTTSLQSVIQNAAQQGSQADGINPQSLQQQAVGQAHGAHHGHHHHHGGGVQQSNGSSSTQQTSGTDALTSALNRTSGSYNTNSSSQVSSPQNADFLLQISATSGNHQPTSDSLLNIQV